MLNRQRVLINLLVMAGRAVSKIDLMKWCFLLRNETRSSGGSAFYHFLPYQYGPFSFCLYREIDHLIKSGLVNATDSQSWQTSDKSAEVAQGLSKAVREDIAGILQRFESTPTSHVMDYVYHRYPWFTINSKQKQLAVRPVGELAVYTAGYEGLQIDAFLNLLLKNGVQQLIDVRNNPISRRYGFHKSTLSRLCGLLEIGYLHLPELGILPALRRSLETQADFDALFSQYETGVLSTNVAAIEAVTAIVLAKPSVLVCMESDAKMCHRSRLARSVAVMSRLPVRHLKANA